MIKGWEKPYLTKFRESNSPKFTLLKDKFNNIDEFSFNFDLQSNEKQIQLKIDFFDEDILKFSSINSLKKSKLNLNDIIPLEISPNLKSEFVFENQTESIEIFSKLIQKFRISVKKNPFCIEILNKNNEKIIGLNSRNCLNSSKNPSIDFDFEHEFLFGIPERAEKFLLSDTSNGNPYRLYNLDRFGYDLFNRSGLYGSIPLLIGQYPNKTVAIFWRNSSLTYIDLNVDKITKKSNCFWLSESGDLEFYIIVGLNVDDLFFKIGKLLGFAPLPPYFALGYHHSKWSFNDQKDVEEVDQNFDLNEIPYDVIYLDIDYTDQMKYFTFDLQKFPDPLGLCDALEQKGRKLVTIIDPHIKCQKEYFLYDEGVKNNYFVKNEENQDFRASCWPNSSHWLDFLNKDVENYWASLFAYDKFIYSKSNVHIWNDMNEPAVFGVADNTMPKNLLHKIKTYKGEEITVEHGEIHNLYGFCQARATYKGLIARNEDKNQRSFVLTRSFFAGIQKYAAVWTGDTLTTWPFLKITLPMLLSLSVCGVGFVGADIGGFHIDPPENLHIRWFQSAVVYPYFRGHSTKKSKRREPWLYGKNMMNIIREAIILRYEIIPYIYTLFYEHSTKNIPVLRPLWCVLPEKTSIYGVDDKVMLGDCILSSPILDEKQDKF